MKKVVCCGFVPFLTALKLYGLIKITTFHITSVDAVAPYIYRTAVTRHCPVNKFVLVYDNGTKRCTRCSRCPKGFQVQVKCSEYNDTVCEPCSPGWYNDYSGSKCKPCSGCETGEYIRHDCKKTRNTKCRKCPRGTYSIYLNVTSCLPCKRCRQNEKRVSKCSTDRDTVCGDCFDDHFRVSSTDSCFPCSPCPSKLQYRVVPECRNKLGIHHSDICWPSGRGWSINDSRHGTDIDSESILQTELEDYEVFELFTFVTALLGCVLCCCVILVVTFICLRSKKCRNVLSIPNHSELNMTTTNLHEERYDEENERTINVTHGNYLVRTNCSVCTDFDNDIGSVFTNETLPLKDQEVLMTDSQTASSQWFTDNTPVVNCRSLDIKAEKYRRIQNEANETKRDGQINHNCDSFYTYLTI